MIAMLTGLFMLGLGLYIKYRFHIQFVMLIRKGLKYVESKKTTPRQ